MSTTTTLTREAALALARRLGEAANRHDVARIIECYAEDATASSPQFLEMKGRAAIARAWNTLFAMFPDCRFELSDLLVDGNRMAIIGFVSATDRGGWFGLPPTGSQIRYALNILCSIVDGMIVREERIYDSAGVVERLEKVRLDRELKMAAEVQRALLAHTSFTGPFYDIAARSQPCRAIGGDFFDVMELPSGSVALVVGDIAGKGPAAALLAAMLQGVFASAARDDSSPAQSVARMNRILSDRQAGAKFATLVYGVLSPDGRFVYSNAGHNPPALVGRRGVRRLTSGGPLLGAFADTSFDQETLQLADGESLVLFSDGIIEARDAADEEFGDQRLLASVAQANASPGVMIERLFDAVRRFSGNVDQGDDMTVAVARYR
jgi:sigma-B regulation protein RsbU (phosphoserine phosphatase)